MKIQTIDGSEINSNNVSDIDAHLLEETNKLSDLYQKYNRQLFVCGEVKSNSDRTINSGISFFNIADPNWEKSLKLEKWANFFERINIHILTISNNQLSITTNYK